MTQRAAVGHVVAGEAADAGVYVGDHGVQFAEHRELGRLLAGALLPGVLQCSDRRRSAWVP